MLYLASSNPNKIKEFQEIMPEFSFELLDKDVAKELENVESGTTFLENAFLKAKKAHELTNATVIADDSGLEIEALNGFPGIYSARFAAPITDYKIKNQLILDRLQGIENRKAQFHCALVIITKDGKVYKGEGIMEGSIAYEASGNKGFGYDPLFIPKGYQESVACLDSSVKNKISHRYRAYCDLKSKLPESFLRRECHD